MGFGWFPPLIFKIIFMIYILFVHLIVLIYLFLLAFYNVIKK